MQFYIFPGSRVLHVFIRIKLIWHSFSSGMPRYKWRRHVTIMATWFPIWAQHRELSSKKDSKYQLLQSQSNSKAHVSYWSQVMMAFWCASGVCATWKGAMGSSLSLTCLWWICSSYNALILWGTGQAAAAGNAHWPQWEEPRSEKVMSKETRHGEVYQASVQNQTWIMSPIVELQCNKTLSWKAGMKPQTTSLQNFNSFSLEFKFFDFKHF